VTIANKHPTWAVIRLATLQKKGEVDRLLFTTVTELAPGRPVPPGQLQPDRFPLKGSEDRVLFRRIVLPKELAISWYLALAEGETNIPIPEHHDQSNETRPRLRVPRLKDSQPWPVLGLPFSEGLFSRSRTEEIKQAPFIGSVPARLHQRFGNRAGLDAFLGNPAAHLFVAHRMHINLFDYQEYLGSAVYIAPDPVVRQIDHFMVPAKDGHGERIFYRLVPRPGQRLDGLRLTTFDKEVGLLTRFETHPVPADGIVVLDKGTCVGEYGYVVSHDALGVLAYSPPAGFLRQMNLSVQAHSGKTLNVRVPTGSAPDAAVTEYQAADGTDWESTSVLGEQVDGEASTRVAKEARKRERQANARLYGQQWFSAGSREEAMQFIQDLLRAARSRVMIADPYLGALQLAQFLYAVSARKVKVTLLTTKLAFTPSAPDETRQTMLALFQQHLAQLKELHRLQPLVAVISTSELHDRFLVVDDDVWFVGNSLNSLGDKASMIVRLPDPTPVIAQLQSLTSAAPALDAYIRKSNKTGASSGMR
jgi:hypothetical protein